MPTEFDSVVDSLVKSWADEYVQRLIDRLDEETLHDEDAFRDAMCNIEDCLKGDMPYLIREAEEEARMMLK